MQSPSVEDLQRLHDLYGRGLCMQAFEAAQQFGDLSTWQTTEGHGGGALVQPSLEF